MKEQGGSALDSQKLSAEEFRSVGLGIFDMAISAGDLDTAEAVLRQLGDWETFTLAHSNDPQKKQAVIQRRLELMHQINNPNLSDKDKEAKETELKRLYWYGFNR